jgi:hypothetical protein
MKTLLFDQMRLRLLAAALPAVSASLYGSEAMARVGGGQTYSGGSDDSDGDLVSLLCWLLFKIPAVGIPLIILCGVGYLVYHYYSRLPKGLSIAGKSSFPGSDRETSAADRDEARRSVIPILGKDPKFSLTLFLDFASALAQRSLIAVSTPVLANLEPYVSGTAFTGVFDDMILQNVVVGSVTISNLQQSDDWDQITVAVSFCATMIRGDRQEPCWFESEWFFRRRSGVVSKGPSEMLKLSCPSCGATSDKDTTGACAYCGNRLIPGSETWAVTAMSVTSQEPRPPLDPGRYAREQGTFLPTVFSPLLTTCLQGIAFWDHSFSMADAEKRFREVFLSLQEAWSNRDLTAIRPLVTDHLYRVYRYWIEAYREAGLRNVISNISVISLEIVAADIDPFYDSITARIAASMVDRCLDEGGRVVGGDNDPRSFSEYWTFVRVARVTGPTDSAQSCSGCGASLEVGMTGACSYCGMLASGVKFDWILSRITQVKITASDGYTHLTGKGEHACLPVSVFPESR